MPRTRHLSLVLLLFVGCAQPRPSDSVSVAGPVVSPPANSPEPAAASPSVQRALQPAPNVAPAAAPNEVAGNVEIKGELTLQDIDARLTSRIDPDSFNSMAELGEQLKKRGSLTLRDATFTLPLNDDKIGYLALDKLNLVSSRINVRASNLVIICNALEFDKSVIGASADSTAQEGEIGASVGESGHGGWDGLSAGTVRIYVLREAIANGKLQVSLSGQQGGNGGNGAQGAPGVAGKRGRNCANAVVTCKAGCSSGVNGSMGGKGGQGGFGGPGGDGGVAEILVPREDVLPASLIVFSSTPGEGGGAGRPGAGGIGGKGGAAGRSTCSRCSGTCVAGDDGKPGDIGAAGKAGARGTSKPLTRRVFDFESLKAAVRYIFVTG